MIGPKPAAATLFPHILALALAGAGDPPPPALSERLWSFHQRILSFLRYRTGSQELAEELLSETYLAFLQAQPDPRSFRDDAALRNYLLTIAANKLRDHWRRPANQARRHLNFPDQEALDLWWEQQASAEPDPAARLADQDEDQRRRDLVAAAMASLPERYQRVLALKFSQGLGNPAIAQSLDLGIKAVESLLVRAKAAFRKEFETLSLANESAAIRVISPKGGSR